MSNMPINILIDKLYNELVERGLSKITLSRYRKIFNEISIYCNDKSISNFTESIGFDFLEDRFNLSKISELSQISVNEKFYLRVINMLGEYQLNGIILYRYKDSNINLNSYNHYLLDEFNLFNIDRNLTNSTIKTTSRYIKKFLFYLEKNNHNIKDINHIIINNFLKTIFGVNSYTISQTLTCLKQFLKYLFDKNIINLDFSNCLPKLKVHKLKRLPSVWNNEDIDKLLKSVDRNNPLGKRDYAIILLAIRYGIRAIDIKNLKFSNFNWQNNTIEFAQTKTKKLVRLPLFKDVGWAIIDYIKNGRPVSESDTIFVRHIPPYVKLMDDSSTHTILKRYIKLAKISISNQKTGLHSLRHTLATSLLEKNVPIEIISNILGHKTTETTSIYLKNSIELLRECCNDQDFIL
jgi:site-specific recombinase XerD